MQGILHARTGDGNADTVEIGDDGEQAEQQEVEMAAIHQYSIVAWERGRVAPRISQMVLVDVMSLYLLSIIALTGDQFPIHRIRLIYRSPPGKGLRPNTPGGRQAIPALFASGQSQQCRSDLTGFIRIYQ